LGAAAFFGVGIGQLEPAGLGCQAKNQPCFRGSRRRLGESQPIAHYLFTGEFEALGNTLIEHKGAAVAGMITLEFEASATASNFRFRSTSSACFFWKRGAIRGVSD
jgi:hypothetical protein